MGTERASFGWCRHSDNRECVSGNGRVCLQHPSCWIVCHTQGQFVKCHFQNAVLNFFGGKRIPERHLWAVIPLLGCLQASLKAGQLHLGSDVCVGPWLSAGRLSLMNTQALSGLSVNIALLLRAVPSSGDTFSLILTSAAEVPVLIRVILCIWQLM